MGNDISSKGKYEKMGQEEKSSGNEVCKVNERETVESDASSSIQKVKKGFSSPGPGYRSLQVEENEPENKQKNTDNDNIDKNMLDTTLEAGGER